MKIENDLLNQARKFAFLAHNKQQYCDESYFDLHLEKVVITTEELLLNLGYNDPEVISFTKSVAYLHDYLEDVPDYNVTSIKIEFEKLSSEFSYGLASAVLILSRNSCKNEDEYYKNISENLITRVVKTADRISNILSLPLMKEKTRMKELYNKYLSEMYYFKKYDIYPELIIKAFEGVAA